MQLAGYLFQCLSAYFVFLVAVGTTLILYEASPILISVSLKLGQIYIESRLGIHVFK